MTSNWQGHAEHSRLVRFLELNPVMNAFSAEGLALKAEKWCYLKSPHDGYLVQVSFMSIEGRPDIVHIRSTNWRAEHEPSGIVSAEDARKVWKKLRAAGFVAEPARTSNNEIAP